MTEKLSPRPIRRPRPAARAARPTQPAAAAATGDGYGDAIHEGGSPLSRFFVFAALPSWMSSMLFHIALLFVLALITISTVPELKNMVTLATPPDDIEDTIDDIEPIPPKFASKPIILRFLIEFCEFLPENLRACAQNIV